MASPSMESFCCLIATSTPDIEWVLSKDFVSYNIVCTVSAVIGLFGALYQLLPYSEEVSSRRHVVSIRSQRKIIRWLAFADVMATLGILIRSITWIAIKTPTGGIVFCAVMSMWIHFFYSATYIWTILYAVDVYLATREKMCESWKYHTTVWPLAALVTSISLFTLFFPNFKCHEKSTHVMINYIFTYIPIVIAMVVNPILYVLATKEVKQLLTSYHARFSDSERKIISAIREHFIFIVLVFYCCWLPNIICGLILWSTWSLVPRRPILSLMYMMAILNPLQAFLNSLVYRGWTFCGKTITNLFCPSQPLAGITPPRSEITPVLEDEAPLVNSE